MPKYTVELRHVLEQKRNIFDFNYAFYDEKARPKFEHDFVRHFFFREICTEDIDRFLWLLEDKMQTVFPYYNELFRTAQIEYSVLDNYYLKETITREQENTGKTSGVTSTVEQAFDTQVTDTHDTSRDSVALDRTSTNKTTHNTTDTTSNNETVSETVNKEGTTSTDIDEDITKKFLDTPQGSVNIDDANFITTLNADKRTQDTTATAEEDTTSNRTTEGNGTVKKTGDTTVTATEIGTDTINKSTTGSVDFEGERRSTADNNTRTELMGSLNETMITERKGNIGVDADADMIQKHMKLQAILKKIALMFFDECEDLFMGVY